ncbi:MAG TPA: alkaline phosphatase family protein [Candidatus Acidoferrum sp.]|jgi:phospholipase C|nr:alkaline phosphatase family protein [Candidatus Acidoferrum sp.]
MRLKCLRVLAAVLPIFLSLIAAPGILRAQGDSDDSPTATPIKHVVVIFQENVSFDHYFGTYPHAQPNTDGSIYFKRAKDGTPRVNNLESAGLLTNNPNAVNPFRMDRAFPNTCDQDHVYGDEQFVFHGGLMDGFTGTKPGSATLFSCNDPHYGKFSVMGYFDGNTVTALWNYAQNFAMSDNHYGTSFGPSTPGLLNLLSGSTYGGTIMKNSPAGFISGGATFGTVIGDADPFGDMCSGATRGQVQMTVNPSVGDLLNAAGISWGAFMGGFNSCTKTTTGLTGLHASTDYIPHHAFTQYWASTLNPNHTAPASDNLIGKSDGVSNHEYDLSLFFTALKEHRLPAVSILKAPAYEDGHAGYSDPLDEQFFLVNTINTLMKSDEWKETAILITWDDSDGWYDHVLGPIILQSNAPEDQLLGPKNCGTPKPVDAHGDIQNGRCGYGPRIPLMVISPYARKNYVDHRVLDQSSILRFIEDNWSLGRIGIGSTDAFAGSVNGMFDFDRQHHGSDRDSKLILDPMTGVVVDQGGDQ